MTTPRLFTILVLVVPIIAFSISLATFRHAPSRGLEVGASVIGWMYAGLLPPLLLKYLPIQGGGRQLAVIAWRMPLLLIALASANQWSGEAKNCFLRALLACYFVSLPLESWILIRMLNRSSQSR